MRKGVLTAIMAFMVVLTLSLTVSATESGGIEILVDGKPLLTDASPVMEDGRVLVPMRAIFEALEAKVDYNHEDRSVTAILGSERDSTMIKLYLDSKVAFMNGKEIKLDVPAKVVGGRTMVPVRFVSESMGCSVEWDGSVSRVVITSAAKAPFYVWRQYKDPLNHFTADFMGDTNALKLNENWTGNPFAGSNCLKVDYDPQAGSSGWAGIYWQNPAGNWGNIKNAGYDLTGAVRLTFYARSDSDAEFQFLCGGITGTYPDTFKVSGEYMRLTPEWTKYYIDLTDEDLSYCIGGFCLVTNKEHCPTAASVCLDEIRYEYY